MTKSNDNKKQELTTINDDHIDEDIKDFETSFEEFAEEDDNSNSPIYHYYINS